MNNAWTSIAKSYDKVLRKWSLYQEIKDRVTKHITDEEEILDQGCGTGIIAIELAKRGKTVYGVDNNPFMLDIAREKIADGLDGKFIVEEGDVQTLRFDTESFDAVVSTNVIFYVENPKELLSEAYRVLKPGKKLILVGPKPDLSIEKIAMHCYKEFESRGDLESFKEHLDAMAEANRMMVKTGDIKNVYDSSSLVEILKETGFTNVIETSDDLYLGGNYLVVIEK